MRHKTHLVLFILLLILAGCSTNEPSFLIKGRLLSEKGEPLPIANVAVRSGSFRANQMVEKDGSFSLEVPRTGPYYLTGTGLFHNSFFQPLFVDEGHPTEVIIRMETVQLLPELEQVGVIGHFNDFNDDDGVIPLTKQADGTWTGRLAAPADTFAYQLMGVQYDEYMLEGTHADYYARDTKYPTVARHSGKYVSVLNAPGDSVDIVFDPTMIPQGSGLFAVEFVDPESRAAQIDGLFKDFEVTRAAFNDAFTAVRAEGGSFQDLVFDWETPKAEMRRRLAAEPDSLIKDYITLSYIEKMLPNQDDVDMMNRMLEEVSPSSTMWSFVWASPTNLLYRAKSIATSDIKTDDYALRVVDQNPDSVIQAAFLEYVVADRFQKMKAELEGLSDEENTAGEGTRDFSILFHRLTTEYAESPEAKRAVQQFAPSRAIQTGLPAPPLEARVLPDTSTTSTISELKSKVTLVEFWALWCGPCIGEMPTLHEAYEQFKDRGLEIVSISVDEDPRDVAAFRSDKFPMPWKHLWLKDGWKDEIMTRYEVAGIPKALLIDESGAIIATSEDLRQGKLLGTLESVFQNLDAVK